MRLVILLHGDEMEDSEDDVTAPLQGERSELKEHWLECFLSSAAVLSITESLVFTSLVEFEEALRAAGRDCTERPSFLAPGERSVTIEFLLVRL
jgi:hypothetical protein